MDTKIKYATMIVRDMEESIKFYTDIMGYEIDSRYNPMPGSHITLMKNKGETLIELIENKNYPTGYYSVGMEVQDMNDAVSELKSKGIRFIVEPVSTSVGSFALFEDPNGVRIGLIKHD